MHCQQTEYTHEQLTAMAEQALDLVHKAGGDMSELNEYGNKAFRHAKLDKH
jgi:hypothetical protein